MRHQTKTFIEELLKAHGPFTRVLDVGSLDVNGHLRKFFPDSTYVGVDMRDGENVDVVCNGHDLVTRFGEASFDLVLCFDTLEHDDRFWQTWEQCRAVCKVGGFVALGVPGRNHPQHDHPRDYWRFMPHAFEDYFLQGLDDTRLEIQTDDPAHQHEDEIYGWGRRRRI